MIVAGLDLSLRGAAVARADRCYTVDGGLLAQNASIEERADRMERIRAGLAGPLRGAQLVVLEGPAYGKNLPSTWDRAGVWWDTYRQLRKAGFLIAVVPPANLKRYAAANGNATKTAVTAAACRLFPALEIRNDNEADALILRAMGLEQLGQPVDPRWPAQNRVGLAGCAWPPRLR